MRGIPSLGHSNQARIFFNFWKQFCFLYNIHYLHCNNKSSSVSQWSTCQLPRRLGLEVRGSIPASNTLYFLISFQVIICARQLSIHHASSPIQAPDGQWPDLLVHKWRNTKSLVHTSTLDQKKSKGPAFLGLHYCFSYSQIRPNTPLSSILFILFY